MDYHSSKYSFGDLTEHISRLESKFQLNNLYGKEALQDTAKLCEQNIFSANQKGLRNGIFSTEIQNDLPTEKSSFEKSNLTTRYESPKCDDVSERYRRENMKPEDETNYIVKLEKMSNDELIYAKKIHSDSKDRKNTGEKYFDAALSQ